MERSCHNCSPQDRRSPDCFAAESAAAAEGAVELDAAVVESAGAAAVAESAEAVAVAAVAAVADALVVEVDETIPDGTGVAAAVDDSDSALNAVAAVATAVAAVAVVAAVSVVAVVAAATLVAANVADELDAVVDIACDWVSRSTHGSVRLELPVAIEP